MKKSKKLAVALLSSVGLFVILSAASLAQPPGPPPNLNAIYSPGDWPIQKIRDGKVYWIPGGGSNSTIIIGDKGVIVVDVKTTMATGQQLLKDIATITPKPITHVIETHSDCDHVNGIVAFPKSVNILAHISNLQEQEQVARLATIEVNGGYGVAPQDRLPNMLSTKNGETATIDGVRFVFYHFGPAHTGGDLMIYLPDEKVMVAGDIIFNSNTAGPDNGLIFKFEKNGSTSGLIKNIEGMLATDANIFVTGHGDKLLARSDVEKLLADFRAKMAKVDALAASGKSLEETTKEMGDRPVDMLANNIHPDTMKECPRGTISMSASWIEWHEWQNQHHGLGETISQK